MGAPAVDTSAKKVVIAVPEDSSRQALSHFLRDKGLEVIETSDGSKALSETLRHRPSILILDLAVSVLGAERLVQILRTNPNTKAIPIFFLSDKEKSVSGFRGGVDEFIRKPFHEEEVLLRIHRALFQGKGVEAFAADSEISGNLSQIFLPDLWQMLSMYKKSGIIQVEGESVAGSVYIETGEIVSAVSQNVVGEKALFRLITLKDGKFRFMPGKVDVRRTIFSPSQHALLEGLRQFDELAKLAPELPKPFESVSIVKDVKPYGVGGGAIREVLLLCEFCNRVEDVVNNCALPDLVVYETLLQLKKRGVLRIGEDAAVQEKSEFLQPDEMARLRARMEDRGTSPGKDASAGQVVFFLPDNGLLENLVLALGQFREFEVDKAFFSRRDRDGMPIGIFGSVRVGEGSVLLLYALPYMRATSPLWYALAPRPIGIAAFLKDEVTSSLEGLMAVSDFARGTDTRALMAVMGKTFTNFGLGEHTLRLFRNRVEKVGCRLKVQEMDEIGAAEIRDALSAIIRQYLEIEEEGEKA